MSAGKLNIIDHVSGTKCRHKNAKYAYMNHKY